MRAAGRKVEFRMRARFNEKLDGDLGHVILSWLDPPSRLMARATCRAWRALITKRTANVFHYPKACADAHDLDAYVEALQRYTSFRENCISASLCYHVYLRLPELRHGPAMVFFHHHAFSIVRKSDLDTLKQRIWSDSCVDLIFQVANDPVMLNSWLYDILRDDAEFTCGLFWRGIGHGYARLLGWMAERKLVTLDEAGLKWLGSPSRHSGITFYLEGCKAVFKMFKETYGVGNDFWTAMYAVFMESPKAFNPTVVRAMVEVCQWVPPEMCAFLREACSKVGKERGAFFNYFHAKICGCVKLN